MVAQRQTNSFSPVECETFRTNCNNAEASAIQDDYVGEFGINTISNKESSSQQRNQARLTTDERKESQFIRNNELQLQLHKHIAATLLVLVLLANTQAVWRQNHAFVACQDSLFGGPVIFGDPYGPLPTFRPNFRHMNLPHPFSGNNNNNNQNNRPGMYTHNRNLASTGDGEPLNDMPSSAVESFFSDQNGDPSLSTGAPIVGNGWSSLFSASTRAPSANVQRDATLDKHVKNILVPRVSGTPGNVIVRQYIVDALEANDYAVQLDEFTDSTPVGKVKFANIIASSNPNACKQLVLACHYDSKMMDGFLGAVDSAVPCAMLLKISETFKSSFRQQNLGLQFIFFDGEEAYHQWGPTDSLYGSRHLAAKWEKQKAPEQCATSNANELSRIELLVLLDLIGAKDTSFVVYTHYDPAVNRAIRSHHESFRRHERAYLTNTNGLTSAQANRETAFKSRQMPIYMVEDDHVPFMKRGVPILSLLASPFPKVWHTVADNYEAIDFPKTQRILYVLEQWLAEYEQKHQQQQAPPATS